MVSAPLFYRATIGAIVRMLRLRPPARGTIATPTASRSGRRGGLIPVFEQSKQSPGA
jgi:hypothetical protein